MTSPTWTMTSPEVDHDTSGVAPVDRLASTCIIAVRGRQHDLWIAAVKASASNC